MKSLIKIRSKYLFRHPCLLFWSYLFLPGLFFILSFYLLRTRQSLLPPKHLKNEPLMNGEDYFFNQMEQNTKKERTYDSIKMFLENTSIIINDESYCQNIIDFIVEVTNVTVNCSFYKNTFPNETTHVLKFEKIENKFKIFLIEILRKDDTKVMFEKSELDQDKILDLFFISNVTRNISTFEENRFKRYV